MGVSIQRVRFFSTARYVMDYFGSVITWRLLAHSTFVRLRGSTLTHGLVPCVTGMGFFFQAALVRNPQHDQFQLLSIRCCAESIQSFSNSRSYRISIAQWIRRRAIDHPVPRSNPDIGFFRFLTFLFFHGTLGPLACESSYEYSTSIFIGRGFVQAH